MNTKELTRCPWCLSGEEMIQYHDTEWGVPVHDDTKWFEYIVLDSFQAGLSWKTILLKREGFSKAFHQFNYKKVAKMSPDDIEKLYTFDGIIKNKLKINATVTNAQAFLRVQKEYGSFDAYIWKFTQGKPLQNKLKNQSDIPAKTAIAEQMSKELKKLGFKFVGPTICYAFMQASGMVNDHLLSCFRYQEVSKMR